MASKARRQATPLPGTAGPAVGVIAARRALHSLTKRIQISGSLTFSARTSRALLRTWVLQWPTKSQAQLIQRRPWNSTKRPTTSCGGGMSTHLLSSLRHSTLPHTPFPTSPVWPRTSTSTLGWALVVPVCINMRICSACSTLWAAYTGQCLWASGPWVAAATPSSGLGHCSLSISSKNLPRCSCRPMRHTAVVGFTGATRPRTPTPHGTSGTCAVWVGCLVASRGLTTAPWSGGVRLRVPSPT
mmetsp:Transcript_37832/g.87861  ORF Transcript_37832/g.87861 Transcript_37832/m.87861 type:complete len:243 (+) Transcript_37832:624-1352(+)